MDGGKYSRLDDTGSSILVVLKIGGSAVTDKRGVEALKQDQLGNPDFMLSLHNWEGSIGTARLDLLLGLTLNSLSANLADAVAAQLSSAYFDSSVRFVIVHGAGSFGHSQVCHSLHSFI